MNKKRRQFFKAFFFFSFRPKDRLPEQPFEKRKWHWWWRDGRETMMKNTNKRKGKSEIYNSHSHAKDIKIQVIYLRNSEQLLDLLRWLP